MNLNKRIKAFLFDIDGTLVNREIKMTDNLKKALMVLKEKGYHLSINTGRPAFAVENVLNTNSIENDFEYFFCCNGVEKYNVRNKTTDYLAYVSADTIKELDKFFNEDYLSLCVYDGADGLLFNHYPHDEYLYQLWCKQRFSKPGLIDFQKNEKNYPKTVVIFELKRKEDFLKKIENLKNDKIDFFLSGVDVMEIVPKGINKGRSVLEYSRILNIDPKEILCVGDAESDLPALKKGTGLLLGDDVKCDDEEIAYHYPSVLEDGLYHFLKDEGFLD